MPTSQSLGTWHLLVHVGDNPEEEDGDNQIYSSRLG